MLKKSDVRAGDVLLCLGNLEGTSAGAWVRSEIDGATGRADPTPRRIDLSTLRDVRLELAAVYRKLDAGEIETQDATRRAYVLKTIHDVIVSAELERRITDLEERQALPGSNAPRLTDARQLN